MNCREFRNNHVLYVDGLLSAGEALSMVSHGTMCSQCAALDVRIRRSLLVAWNVPDIEPSPDFMTKLSVRLADPYERPEWYETDPRSTRSIRAVAALAAALVVAG